MPPIEKHYKLLIQSNIFLLFHKESNFKIQKDHIQGLNFKDISKKIIH